MLTLSFVSFSSIHQGEPLLLNTMVCTTEKTITFKNHNLNLFIWLVSLFFKGFAKSRYPYLLSYFSLQVFPMPKWSQLGLCLCLNNEFVSMINIEQLCLNNESI